MEGLLTELILQTCSWHVAGIWKWTTVWMAGQDLSLVVVGQMDDGWGVRSKMKDKALLITMSGLS